MADKKISALRSASTPLAGTEVLPIVQSGTTSKVAVSDLTAGRAISATQLTLSTGNLIVANGQGIDFSATSGPGTGKLLADYEEGNWTPNQGSGLTVTGAFSSAGSYTKVGRIVYLTGSVTGATSIAVGSGYAVICTNLPFFSNAVGTGLMFNAAATSTGGMFCSGAVIYSASAIANTATIQFSMTYIA